MTVLRDVQCPFVADGPWVADRGQSLLLSWYRPERVKTLPGEYDCIEFEGPPP